MGTFAVMASRLEYSGRSMVKKQVWDMGSISFGSPRAPSRVIFATTVDAKA